METITEQFLAESVPDKWPILLVLSKLILSILKCLYQRWPLASWSRVIGVDIRGPFRSNTNDPSTIRYRCWQDRCPRSALFHNQFFAKLLSRLKKTKASSK